MNLNTNLEIIIPALCVGLIVLSTHVPLGIQVLQRGIIFIDLAIAQVASLGSIVAIFLGIEIDNGLFHVLTISFAILGAFLIQYLEHKYRDIQEALIGIIFVLSATLAMIILEFNPHGGEVLKNLLVGQILWVNSQQIIMNFILSLILCFLIYKKFNFYLTFAVAITLSLQLVGMYLVFASLILPAVGSLFLKENLKSRLIYAYIISSFGYLIGLIASMYWDLPAGNLIVWALGMNFLLLSFIKKYFSKEIYKSSDKDS